jgi:DNA-binding IscR family transcriptional regulator
MATALAVLERLYRGGQTGELATEPELGQIDAVDPQLLPAVLDDLLQLHLIVRAQEEGWLLARDPASVRLYDLLPVFGVTLIPISGLPADGPSWLTDVAGALTNAERSARAELDTTLRDLFERADGRSPAAHSKEAAQ